MNKVEKIQNYLKRVLSSSDVYKKDFSLSTTLIQGRKFEELQELVASIITKEEKKPKVDRIINFSMLIEAKVLIDEYYEQLQYNPEIDGEFED